MARIKNGKLENPLVYTPIILREERARARGKEYFKKYLRNIASNYIKRPAVREFVFKRDGSKCVYCGTTENLQVDHIISVYSGGKNHIDNLQTLCRGCNAGKKV